MCMVVAQSVPSVFLHRSLGAVIEFWATEERADYGAAEANIVDQSVFSAGVRGEEVGCLHWAGPWNYYSQLNADVELLLEIAELTLSQLHCNSG